MLGLVVADQMCAFETCDRARSPKAGGGLCAAHYQQRRANGVLSDLPSDRTLEERFWVYATASDEHDCWLWRGACDRHGYGRFRLNPSLWFDYAPDIQQVGAHQLSLALHQGSWPQRQTLHHCDVRRCVSPSHLYEGDHYDNMRDKTERNPTLLGLPYQKSRLTIEDVRGLRAGVVSDIEVAEKRGVQEQTAAHARRRITWKWLDPA